MDVSVAEEGMRHCHVSGGSLKSKRRPQAGGDQGQGVVVQREPGHMKKTGPFFWECAGGTLPKFLSKWSLSAHGQQNKFGVSLRKKFLTVSQQNN
jgi:hypothetical protein